MMMQTTAQFSPCRLYRYRLSRLWDATKWKQLVVIGLNPSTADETTDDPTIRRCIAFAKREECGELVMLNLFALRSTDPREIRRAEFPVSERAFPNHNDQVIYEHTREIRQLDRIVVAAWGAFDTNGRSTQVRDSLATAGIKLHCFGLTKLGHHPRHPLYLRADTPLGEWVR